MSPMPNGLKPPISSSLSLTLVIIFLGVGFASLARADIDELKEKINERNNQIKQLEAEIAGYQNDLEQVGKDKQSLESTLKNLNLTQKKLTAEIKLTQSKIDATTEKIKELASGILDKKTRLETITDGLGELLRNLNKFDQETLVETLLGKGSISEFWNTVSAIEKFSANLKAQRDTIKEIKAELENRKQESEIQKKKLLSLKTELKDRNTILEANKQEKNQLLLETKSKESNYKKILADKFARRDAFKKELLEFESQLKFEIDPSRLPSAGSRVLSWPLDVIKITQYFGNTAFARANPQVYSGLGHNGIDFRASIGTPVKSALKGKVRGIGNTDTVCRGGSYGKWVLIDHDNGLSTLYAHFSLIKVGEGDYVETGQVIGYSGDTGYATGPHLHFTVYASQAVQIVDRRSRVCAGVYHMPVAGFKGYLNPLSYL